MESESISPGEGLSTENFMREVGAKVLNQAGFRGGHEQIVDSSFEKFRKTGEKLVGKNDERRVDAYLERLNRGIEKYGTDYENRLWRMTEDSLIIDADNIPESYWKTQEQILRDNGQDRELGDHEKSVLAEDIQKKQRESLKSWTNYLSHEDCPYPTWFKVYAINGVSKMGVFDKAKKVYKKRDKDSVAPYPHFNAAVLGKVYSAISDFYGIDTDTDLANSPADASNDDARKAELSALVKSGNFNKLYSKLLLSEKVIMKTPEKTEDIKGEWIEYKLGEEEKLAEAADGTPWCIASPAVGRSYLTTGRYGQSYGDSGVENDAKFILFHLYDNDGRLADNACASVRLNTDGEVDEISGLNDGQALEDSLVPIVEEKVRSLPGGEKFLRRFADKNKLIAIDRKMQSGAEITNDEFRFIWELDRPIESLDTYNDRDPRIDEFRKKYDAAYAKEKGYIIPDTTLDDVESNLVKYLEDDKNLHSNLLIYAINKKLETSPESVRELLAGRDAEYIHALGERIKNLEALKNDHCAYLLPKDKWKEGMKKLAEGAGPEYIADQDLEVIVLKPFGQYTEKDVGTLRKHHIFNDLESDGVNEWLKQYGFRVPEKDEWVQIVDNLKTKLAEEQGIEPNRVSGKDLSRALRERYNLAFSGDVYEGELRLVGVLGYFWSASKESAGNAWSLSFYEDFVNPTSSAYCCSAQFVRCVA